MFAQIFGLIGLLIVVGSMFANALIGTQIALIGVAFILLGILSELRAIRLLWKDR